MNTHHSYDENGPLIALGDIAFSAATGLPGGRQIFELPAFLVASDTSEVIVEYNGYRLTDFGTKNDYYGFGSSPETALHEARDAIARLTGCNCDIVVKTTLLLRPCFVSDDEPFYVGSQRVCYVPLSWKHQSGTLTETKEDFTVWKNGTPTEDLVSFMDRIEDLSQRDAAPSRKGDLRSIFSRKPPASKATYLREVA